MRFIGLDAGSVSVKLVLLDENGTLIRHFYERHRGHPLSTACHLLRKVLEERVHRQGDEGFSLSVTGSSGRLIASFLMVGFTNELVAQSYATKKLYPHVKTVFELGGEDSKLIILNNRGIDDFSINSVCAAGTGSFLDQQAERLRISIEEFSELSLRSKKPSRIAGRCSVFAKSDMIHLQQIATPFDDIVAGLCFAVARNFKGSIVRGRAIGRPVSFHGGVAANKGMIRAFKDIFSLKELLVPPEHALMGAIGAVLKDLDEERTHGFDFSMLEKLKVFIESSRYSDKGHKPLLHAGDDFFMRHINVIQTSEFRLQKLEEDPGLQSDGSQPYRPRIRAYLGIDIGSISTNLALIDEAGRLLAKRYLMTAGRPIEAVNQGLREIGEEIGGRVEIMGVGTTGSGRYMIADYVGADIVKNEITAQATAAAFIDRDVDTIFEIGGQDSKYISLTDGVIVDFEMNKACAAGTGSFLEEQAEKLDVSVKEEFAQCAFSAKNPCRLGERCTVFMENSLMANLQKGAGKEDLLAGLGYSIVQNYITKVVGRKRIGERIFFQGGVAFNTSVVAAFEKYLGRRITVPPHHDVTGAIGMALIAMKHMKKNSEFRIQNSGVSTQKALVCREQSAVSGELRNIEDSLTAHYPLTARSSFKGFDLSRRSYEISSFECKACPNVCEINRVKIEGEEGYLFFGGRCEKYDVRKRGTSSILDLFAFREEMQWKAHNDYAAKSSEQVTANKTLKVTSSSLIDKTKIGIPYIFFFHDYLPFWTTLLWELGFHVEVSPKTNREIVRTGIENVLADTCFPVKVAHGHLKYLLDKGITTLLIPSFINVNKKDEEFERGYACPLTQTIPYASKVAHPDATIIAPIVNLYAGKERLIAELMKAFAPFRIKKSHLILALHAAEEAQEEFSAAIMAKGEEVLSSCQERTIVIVGRAYNAFDSCMNLDIPKKLRGLGVLSLPMDFLSLERFRIDDSWPNMYWRSGQRILKAARLIKDHPHLYPIYLGNFSCGPDSFILKYFSEELRGKPFLHIEIDEHSADAGAITRCEAFLDSIVNYRPEPPGASTRRISIVPSSSTRTVYIPRMSDHAFGIAAAFERCGVPSEVLPESDRESIDIGRRYVSGKECYPCTVTTGDMLKKVLSPGFRPDASAFFMPSGTGPCRFGQYNVFHTMVLDELGYHDVPIFAPNQDTSFYQDLGIVGKDFTLQAWKGIIAFELLLKCLHETRPYEKETGSADNLYQQYLEKLSLSLRGLNGNTETLLRNARRDFEHLPKYRDRKPLIGIVGEIFVRSHRFSNEDLIRRIEALGGEVWLAPAEEWIYYVNLMGLRKALKKKESSAIIEFLLKHFFQKKIEHRYGRHFKGFLKTLKEPGTKKILKKASPYLHDSFEGEAVLSIGKSIDLIERGVSGIINAMPFGCMPGTIVTSLMRGVTRDYGIPAISVPYDGTESPTMEIQLEAFMNQAKEMSRKG